MRKQLFTAGLIVVRDNAILLAYSRNKQAWYLPGGKIDAGESAKEALVREIEEELGLTLDKDKLVPYGRITADAYGEQELLMEQDCFLYPDLKDIRPNNEIEAVEYFTLDSYRAQEAQVEGVLVAFRRLQADKLLAP
ncbi:NUDIX hydrolase [Sphingobacterium deserti]|uniref:NUDIX hydrolase n=1 Tax=Sphingobacterium deserti TaxID=1229276 RepID=A0A0B8TC40_9SPHI|nr:NUDIX domain-containing protein [Sphingobacterium deserti]KGE15875.1 NUDIX hydrolase [Sphingobacterium deserti]